MNPPKLLETAATLMGREKGLLAMDESNATCNARFALLGIPQSAEFRRRYRALIVNTPRLQDCIYGAILSEETIEQALDNGTSFVRALSDLGILVGIKVDCGAKELAGFPKEKVTEGLDALRERLHHSVSLGARFTKWRAVFLIGEQIPSESCIALNAQALARFAALSQEAGLVPLVEPEVLMTGSHCIEQCAETSEKVLRAVFRALYEQKVSLPALILKTNMILPGSDCATQNADIAAATEQCFLRSVPAAVAGIAFLSGGQSGVQAALHLNAMNQRKFPWPLSFSFARAIQEPALSVWRGEEKNTSLAQQALYHRAKCSAAARRGEYSATVEADFSVQL